ncbi:class II fructose-bisphosphate aldolase [Gelria sp. Kuro-4]|uniref:class II fructose-bisphosphate aldolase n=1 Tax=Gelria sp. Kuro-4 TaxID=2796927 RepID=UPI001BEFD2D8|nr:class II fructose-bisphosphate aldolase [Gelria sp. Kuro-4]BCV24892.1 fructose-bisphosphate aldolase [Gelria sp. Kuro-4]
MTISTMYSLLQSARSSGYAVGAFNVDNLETIEGVALAAEEERSPVIFAVGQGALRYTRLPYLASLISTVAEGLTVPAAIHLDHGSSYGQVLECLLHGFTSVMIDGSALPIEENIALTKKVVEAAHLLGATVEAELGRVGGAEDSEESVEGTLTRVEDAVRFVQETEVDALAVAIGTVHGLYRWEPKLDFERLGAIAKAVAVPLVLHGGSGTPDESIRRAIELGIAKINVATEIRLAFLQELESRISDPATNQDLFKVLSPAREAVKSLAQSKMRLFRSSGRG